MLYYFYLFLNPTLKKYLINVEAVCINAYWSEYIGYLFSSFVNVIVMHWPVITMQIITTI